MLDWAEDIEAIENAMQRYHVDTGMCAALARVVKPRAAARFGHARGIQILPEEGALYLVPRDASKARYWRAHVYVETSDYAVDAVTGASGFEAPKYRDHFWDYAETLRVREVDPEDVDPGIQVEED